MVEPATSDELASIDSLVSSGRLSVDQASHDATGWSVEVPRDASAEVAGVVDLMQDAIGFTCEHSSTLRYRRYVAGEAHPVHPDHFTINGEWLVATAMLCLTVGTGGDTVFPFAQPPIAIRMSRARLVVWFNHVSTGQPDPLSAHFATPVQGGVKTTLTLFAYADPLECAPLRDGLAAVTA